MDTYHQKTNKNGQLLIDLALECNMLIANTKFQKKKGKLWTYISSMNESKSQIDFVLINKKWSNSIKDTTTYNHYFSIGSDHRVLRAKIKISLRKCKTIQNKTPYDWSKLRTDIDLQERYSISVQNRFSLLSKDGQNATELYDNFVKANDATAKELIPKKVKRQKKKTANDPKIKHARNKVQDAFNSYENN